MRLKSLAVVQLLLRSGIDVNHQGFIHESVLYLAVSSCRVELVELLLELTKNGTLELDNSDALYGRTSLMLACIYGIMPIVDHLLDAGANPRKLDLCEWTAKDHAAH